LTQPAPAELPPISLYSRQTVHLLALRFIANDGPCCINPFLIHVSGFVALVVGGSVMVGKGSGRKQSYRKLDLERALKATSDAGLRVRRVTFDREGRPQLEIASGAESEPELDDATEWDRRIKQNAENAKRPA
jgi:hypothetical protein